MVMTQQRYRAPALDKGLDILEFLAEQDGALTQAEIAKALERSPSELYRMLDRLIERGYVRRTPTGDRFELGLRLFVLANRHPPLRRFVRRAEAVMDDVATRARQSCHLVRDDGERLVVVAQAEAPGRWLYTVRTGALVDLFTTGSGQVMLAHQPEDRQRRMIAAAGALDPATVPTPAALKRMIARARRDGFVRKPSQQIFGVTDLSYPILDSKGHAVAALSMPFLAATQKTPDVPDVDQAQAALAHGAAALCADLGWVAVA